jgi:hypothetical protein
MRGGAIARIRRLCPCLAEATYTGQRGTHRAADFVRSVPAKHERQHRHRPGRECCRSRPVLTWPSGTTMMRRRALWIFGLPLIMCAGLTLGLPGAPSPARAHEFSLESVITAFVKIESRQTHLVLRVPLHVLRPVKFPAIGRELDLVNVEPANRRALAALAREITLWEGERPLVLSSDIGRLALPSDRSFERYEDAVAHVAQPPSPGTTLYYDQAYFDAHLTYTIISPT